ncbi:LamG domain-containing protein [Crenothrix polyspora]|uniref:LamG-like jellyroll fold domain-containing protein n=1 Tax=Crenothrix polyspora TaxID=360316 RepID=A0A1R4H6Z5_9GAMM|nr:LamG domain-containing protein [Crenothrix polyspora]SJM91620.1 hypothetical protein CRENPOLYSF1_200001 [Crenothrix polyspora]
MANWNFDDCAVNNSTVKDTSGNQNNGTINGNLSCVAGVSNTALQFDGKSYINVPSSKSLNPVDQLTASFWIRVDDFINPVSTIIHKGGVGIPVCLNNREYAFYVHNNFVFHQTPAGDGSCAHQVYSTKVIEKGKWLHYVGVIDRKKHVMSIYINGKLNIEQPDSYSSFNNNNDDLRIGFSKEGFSWESPFKGALDDVRLYNRALTDMDVQALYTSNAQFSDEFNGTELQSTSWSPGQFNLPSQTPGIITVSGGTVTFGAWRTANTENKVTFSGNKIVIEARFAGLGSGRDTHIDLVDTKTGDYISAGESNYWAGLYLHGSGSFGLSPDSNNTNPSVNTFKEYRITIDGTSFTIERGDTLANITETKTRKLVLSHSLNVE